MAERGLVGDLLDVTLPTLREEAQLVASLGAEAIWISLVTLALARGPTDGLTPWWLLWIAGIVLLAWNRGLRTHLARDGGSNGRVWLLSLAGALVVTSGLMTLLAPSETGLWAGPLDLLRAVTELRLLLGEPAPLTIIGIAGLLMWFRTLRIAASSRGPLATQGRFQIVLVVTVYLLMEQGLLGQVSAIVHALLFFGFSLTAIAIARSIEVGNQLRDTSLPLGRRWLATLLGAVGILLLSSLVIVPIAGGVGALLARFLRVPIAWGLGLAARLLALLDPLILRFFSFVFDEQARLNEPFEQIGELAPTPVPEAESFVISSGGTPLLSILVVVVIALLALWLAWRVGASVGGWLATPVDGVEGDYVRGERGGLGRWWRRLRDSDGTNSNLDPEQAVNTVRRLYRELLRFGEERGLPKPGNETPYEYLEPLERAYPERIGDFRRLTEAYVRVRYGELEFTREEIRALEAAWARIDALARTAEVRP